MKLTEEQIKEIAGNLECGLQCHVHKVTGQMEFHPDPDEVLDPELWQEQFDMIEANKDDYELFEKMDSFQSFRVMEEFVDTLKPGALKSKLENILSRPKPFRNFKYEIDYSDYRQDWFDFRKKAYIEWVKKQPESLNL